MPQNLVASDIVELITIVSVAVALEAVDEASAILSDSELTDYIKTLAPGDPLIRIQAEMIISQVSRVVDRNITLPAVDVYPVTDENKIEWIRAGNIEVVAL